MNEAKSVSALPNGLGNLPAAVATRLTQATVVDLEDANRVFGAKDSGGAVPIVITPRRSGKANHLSLFLGLLMAFTGISLARSP